jgi:hypothetical protein
MYRWEKFLIKLNLLNIMLKFIKINAQSISGYSALISNKLIITSNATKFF